MDKKLFVLSCPSRVSCISCKILRAGTRLPILDFSKVESTRDGGRPLGESSSLARNRAGRADRLEARISSWTEFSRPTARMKQPHPS
jgi:hypothetical protein